MEKPNNKKVVIIGGTSAGRAAAFVNVWAKEHDTGHFAIVEPIETTQLNINSYIDSKKFCLNERYSKPDPMFIDPQEPIFNYKKHTITCNRNRLARKKRKRAKKRKKMTVRKKLEKTLQENGMSETQAIGVMIKAVPLLENMIPDYKFNFNDNADDWPIIMHNILFTETKPIAIKWIEENKPQAWFKEMFMLS